MVRKKIPDRDKSVYNASEACGYLGVCWNTFKSLIREGKIRVVRKGRRYLIPKESIDNYLNEENLFAKTILKSLKGGC
jgi:excisionase family DNA binding protein